MEETPTNPNVAGRQQISTEQTPSNQRANAQTPTSRRPVHTPLNRSVTRDLRNSVPRPTSASGGGPRRPTNNAPTPHAKAARRALNDRRTAVLTPGKNRRRSLRDQRETPINVLRDLGKVLAPKSKPISSSSSSSSGPTPPSQPQPRRSRPSNSRTSAARSSGIGSIREEFQDDSEDEIPLKRPRLSLPIDQEEDDDDDLRPPRLSMVDDDNHTVQSVELPRRMDFDRERESRLLRGSLGGDRLSDVFGTEPTEDVGRQSDAFPDLLEDLPNRDDADDVEYERIDAEPTARESDFGLEMPAGLDETTFAISEPAEDAAPTSPIVEQSIAEAAADAAAATEEVPPFEDADPIEDVSDREPLEDISDRSDEDDLPADAFSDRGDADDAPPEPFSDGEDAEPTAQTDMGEHTNTTRQTDMTARTDVTGRSEITGRTDISAQRTPMRATRDALPPRKKGKRKSQYGIEYPHLPPTFVKRVAQTALQNSGLSNPRVTADTLTALTHASDWFFEQLGDDLGAYAQHAKRKTIEESDMITLMRRQRQVGSTSTTFSLAQKHLPRELLQELRMPLPASDKKRQGKRLRDDDEEEEDDDEGEEA